jgi:hypothetical protein
MNTGNPTEAVAALDLLARMRMACGGNGLRMQDELEVYLKELAVNDKRWRKLCAMLDADDGSVIVSHLVECGPSGSDLEEALYSGEGLAEYIDTSIQAQDGLRNG